MSRREFLKTHLTPSRALPGGTRARPPRSASRRTLSSAHIVCFGRDQAAYSYVANSPLVHHIAFAHSNTVVMTTSNKFDNLNRRTGLSSASSASSAVNSHSQYNYASRRTRVTLLDAIPKGFNHPAQGWPIHRGLPWVAILQLINPERVESQHLINPHSIPLKTSTNHKTSQRHSKSSAGRRCRAAQNPRAVFMRFSKSESSAGARELSHGVHPARYGARNTVSCARSPGVSRRRLGRLPSRKSIGPKLHAWRTSNEQSEMD